MRRRRSGRAVPNMAAESVEMISFFSEFQNEIARPSVTVYVELK